MVGAIKTESAHTSHYVRFDRHSHYSLEPTTTERPTLGHATSCQLYVPRIANQFSYPLRYVHRPYMIEHPRGNQNISHSVSDEPGLMESH